MQQQPHQPQPREDVEEKTGCGGGGGGMMTCEKLDRAANWVGTSVASAFFASLERCACINLSTVDLEDDDEEACTKPLRPLIPSSSSKQLD